MKKVIKIFIVPLFLFMIFVPNVTLAVSNWDSRIDFYNWDKDLENAVRKALTISEGKDKSVGYIYQSELDKIEELSIDYNEVTRIRGIEKLTNLKTLKIYTSSNKDVDIFNDRMLKYALEKNYKRQTYLSKLKYLNKIDLSNNDIDNVSKIVVMVIGLNQVNSLDLSNNNIETINSLGYCKGLNELNLSNNKVNDISSLRYMRNIENLDISGNLVQNIYPLRYLSRLKVLNISGNNIENIYPLERCTELEELYMSGNIQLKDIISDDYIEITQNNVIDDEKITINGRNIRIYSYEWNDHYEIYNNKYIIYKDEYIIYNQTPVDIAPIGELKNLKKLDISGNYLTSIQPLENINKLEYLNLNNNHIKDITPLFLMFNLRELYAENNYQIEDILPISNMIYMETLDLSNNNIDDILPIRNLVNLKYLDLAYNNISNIDSLEYISPHEDEVTGKETTGLIELRLNDNMISNIYPLIGMNNLEQLYLNNEQSYGNNNKIYDLAPLKNLFNIKVIALP